MYDLPRLLGGIFERNARFYPHKTAYVFEGRRITFAQFAERIRRAANALAARGLAHQGRFAILAQNCVEYFEVTGAAETAGYIAVTLNWRLALPELVDIVEDCTPTMLIYETRFAALAEGLRGKIPGLTHFIAIGDNAPNWAERYEDVLAAAPATPPARRPDPEDGVYLIYTSGTTGRPKGVLLSHRAVMSGGLGLSWEFGARPTDRMLIVMPLFHIGGKINQIVFSLIGATIVLHRTFEPVAILRSIEEERVTVAHFAPTMVRALLDAPEFHRYRRDTVRAIQYASAPMSVTLLREAIGAFGPIFTQIYGMTECLVGTILHPHQHVLDGPPHEVRRLASAGQAFFNADLRVVRPDGTDCAIDEIGDILIRGAGIMNGYWNNTGATIETVRDGWMHTGDMGFLDAENFLFVADRKKDMIVSGGENIYPREVEEALLTHPAVEHCAVIGVPDAHWGESVKAFIVLKPEQAATEQVLIDHCRTQIASYKKPRSIDFVDALPRLYHGKIDKKQLRARYWQGQDRQVS